MILFPGERVILGATEIATSRIPVTQFNRPACIGDHQFELDPRMGFEFFECVDSIFDWCAAWHIDVPSPMNARTVGPAT